MDSLRFKALELASGRDRKVVHMPSEKVSEFYGEDTFNLPRMKAFLPQEAFQAVMESREKGRRIPRHIADQVAAGMKAWAMSRGATHYTHWFHPLTGATAEKHDAFIFPDQTGGAMEVFNGSALIQQEPDASSFPSGGIRNTFEARGYTAWDPSSYAFILEQTLCIPTIFVSYTGEALDFKTPLLKALSALDGAATELCRLFDRDVRKVHATLGWEQEYFLVDAALYNARPDLMLTGRTVFGHASARDQQLSDHYFGVIPERVADFMRDFEMAAHRLGIPVRTRHNEVAPNQFECAPVYEEANLAVDHNQLLMDLLPKIARRHHFAVLLHEKPFSLVNGSGKHNNWSMETDKGENLLSPGADKKSNLRFLSFLVVTLKALLDHNALIRAAIASPSNDLRLGANEAPPAIISAFIGAQLTRTLDQLTGNGKPGDKGKNINGLKAIEIPKIPEILMDNTDRNRTSPFAFTGNKFELRAVGSSANCAAPMIALNAAVAQSIRHFLAAVAKRRKEGKSKDAAIMDTIRQFALESRPVLFEGNCYSDAWKTEAAQRGLENIPSSADAFRAFLREGTIRLFSENDILNERELKARYEIRLENFIKKVQIESRVMGDLATNHIIPTAIRYQNLLVENVKGLKEVLDQKSFTKLSKVQLQYIRDISLHINEIRLNVAAMIEARKEANQISDTEAMAQAYDKVVKQYFEPLRYHVDKLEMLVDDELWPLPKYRELLFVR